MGLSILGLAWRSLMNRRGSALLTILAVALSVAFDIFIRLSEAYLRTPLPSSSSSSKAAVEEAEAAAVARAVSETEDAARDGEVDPPDAASFAASRLRPPRRDFIRS